ncbi:MAG: Rpn family recombination-promoting nuclease/putative transposase [Rickettsia endosymbiont of Sceptobius lativentris]|nr:Rpn family recombination-promoting nuclease/putative transposase [Rickettsia endosymbiont of Sceptobius lativentris]
MSKKLKHDKIIRSAFENPFVAREFFEMHLPPHIKDSLIFETLKMEKDSFIEPSLKESILDILFSAKFDGEDGYLFLLLEHQSKPDYYMAFRLFRYMLNIAEHHRKVLKNKKFPFIYPLVFYNGTQKYNAPRNLWKLFENSELVKATWTNDYQLINVHEIPDEQLKETAWSGILQFFMKHIHERDLLKRWQEIAELLPKFAEVNIGIDYIELILYYTLTKISQNDIIRIEKILKSHLNPIKGEEIMGSIVEHWLQQGIEKGRQEGINIGEMKLAEMAKRMLRKNKPLDEIIEFTGFTKKGIEELQKQLKNQGLKN